MKKKERNEQARKLEEDRMKKEERKKRRKHRVERDGRKAKDKKNGDNGKNTVKRKQKKLSPKDKLFKDCEIEDIPEDLSQLYTSFDKKKYRELTLKYHPDKSDYHVGYIKALNKIKDKHQPVTVKHDETWVK